MMLRRGVMLLGAERGRADKGKRENRDGEAGEDSGVHEP
jgi:hypothetical protein